MVFPGTDAVVSCLTPLHSAENDAAVERESLALLRRYNIRAVTAGTLDAVEAWRAAAPDRVIPGSIEDGR